MPKAKEQPDNDQISVADPNDPDVIAFGAAGSFDNDPMDGEIPDCGPGRHWDAASKQCVQDS